MVPSQLAIPTYAALLPRGVWAQVALPFEIPVNFLALAGGGTTSADVQIPAESDFLFEGISVTVTTPGAADTVIPFFPGTIRIFEAGATRGFQTSPMFLPNVAGQTSATQSGGGYPFGWLIPYLVQRGTTLSTEIASLSANPADVRLQYHGLKLFGVRPSEEEMVQRAEASASSAIQMLANLIRGS